jgi:WD40 repeat protein
MLASLPIEVLSLILSDLPSARDVYNLALCSHRFSHFVKSDGWRIFCSTRFPSIYLNLPGIGSHARAAHAMPSRARNVDRTALLASHMQPKFYNATSEDDESVTGAWSQCKQVDAATLRRYHGRKQTMGWQPIIDSVEVNMGGEWASRRELVVWGAGCQVVMRLRETGHDSAWKWIPWSEDHHGHTVWWNIYQPDQATEGADDYTVARVIGSIESIPLRPPKFSLLAGTASGKLSVLKMEFTSSTHIRVSHETRLSTDGLPVQSADISSSGQLIAAVLSNNTVRLYNLDSDGNELCHVFEEDFEQYGRLWSIKFISNSHIALASGPSTQPLQVYSITNQGLSDAPDRVFSAKPAEHDEHMPAMLHVKRTSVLPIINLPSSSSVRYGNEFLSGHSDGTVRLHDLRSPADYESVYFDSVSEGSVYSLLTFGRERLIAGNATNSLLNFYDLRVSGGRSYSYLSAVSGQHFDNNTSADGWSVFIYPNPRHQPTRRGNWSDYRSSSSPVYSLSSPSAYSPSIFAGVEGSCVQLDVVGVYDSIPDTIFGDPPGSPALNAQFWDSQEDQSWTLSLYEHAVPNKLRKQSKLGSPEDLKASAEGFDGRWKTF